MAKGLIKKKDRNYVVVIVMFVWGLIMSILIPTWQTPDERTHLKMIGESVGNSELAEILTENISIELERIEFHPSEKVDIDEQLDSMKREPTYSRIDILPHSIGLDIIEHLPAIVGMEIAVIIGLPSYWVLQFGELFSLIFYVIVCYYALKFMPIKKELLIVIMMLPMALQQAGSINYDSVVLPLSYFFISYILHLKYVKEDITLSDIVKLFVCVGIITYIKVVYVFLIGILLILPLNKIHIKVGHLEIDGEFIKKWRLCFLIIGCILSFLFVYTFKDNRWIQVVYGMFIEWKRGIYLIWQTIVTWHKSLIISSIGNFGWLDTPVAYTFAIFTYITMLTITLMNSDRNENIFIGIKDRIVIWLTGGILYFFTLFSLVNHTIMMTLFGSENIDKTYEIREALYQIPYIGGLQGRYFLPFLLLFFIPFPQIRYVGGKKIDYVLIGFETISMLYVIILLLNRYWLA